MKITKDYVFSVIERLGRAVAQKAAELPKPTPVMLPSGRPAPTLVSSEQKSISNTLWHIQKKVAYGDLRPTAAMEDLNRLCERNKLLVAEEWRNLLRSIAV
jgi:hypothetical protein